MSKRKPKADHGRVRSAVASYRADLAELFDGRTSRRVAKEQARRYAKERLGFGLAEILLFVQVLMALWTVWQKYQERQASFLAATDTEQDPELTGLVASVADQEQGAVE